MAPEIEKWTREGKEKIEGKKTRRKYFRVNEIDECLALPMMIIIKCEKSTITTSNVSIYLSIDVYI